MTPDMTQDPDAPDMKLDTAPDTMLDTSHDTNPDTTTDNDPNTIYVSDPEAFLSTSTEASPDSSFQHSPRNSEGHGQDMFTKDLCEADLCRLSRIERCVLCIHICIACECISLMGSVLQGSVLDGYKETIVHRPLKPWLQTYCQHAGANMPGQNCDH